MDWFQKLPWRSLGRWWIVGVAFYGVGMGTLYLFHDILGMTLILATLMAAEFTTLIRFVINDRWVFGHLRPTWRRLWQYHVAGAGGTAIWWTVSNILPRFGVYYLVAATIGTGCSVFFSMFTNFLWIWRGKHAVPAAARADCEEAGSVDSH